MLRALLSIISTLLGISQHCILITYPSYSFCRILDLISLHIKGLRNVTYFYSTLRAAQLFGLQSLNEWVVTYTAQWYNEGYWRTVDQKLNFNIANL